MKKAPKRYGYKSGGTPTDPNKTKPLVPNTNYPTAAEQMAAKGLINPTTAATYKSENAKNRSYTELNSPAYPVTLNDAGTGTVNNNTRNVQTLSNGLKMVTNPDGTTQYYDAMGNIVQPLQRAEGGGIHLNPEHKGMFTEWAKNHGMSVQEAADHVMANKDKYEAHVVQMANFAKNFGGGKAEGGPVKMMKAPRMNKK